MTDQIRPETGEMGKKVSLIADITGNTVSPVIGAILGGLLGSVAGGAVGSLIKHSLEEFINRFLTPKEQRRVEASAEFILNGISANFNGVQSPKRAIVGLKKCKSDHCKLCTILLYSLHSM